jgi:hypothetical protein
LIGHYLEQQCQEYYYVDPLADNSERVIESLGRPAVVLMAHNRHITYGYTGESAKDHFYCEIEPGSVIVDPWRKLPKDMAGMTVIHYGNTRRS